MHSFLRWPHVVFVFFGRRTFSGKVCSVFELQTERQEELQEFCTDISYPFDDLLCCSLIE